MPLNSEGWCHLQTGGLLNSSTNPLFSSKSNVRMSQCSDPDVFWKDAGPRSSRVKLFSGFVVSPNCGPRQSASEAMPITECRLGGTAGGVQHPPTSLQAPWHLIYSYGLPSLRMAMADDYCACADSSPPVIEHERIGL